MGRLFGTNGIRWRYGSESPDLARLASALASIYDELIVVRDARAGTGVLWRSFTSLLSSAGVEVYDGGLATTPALQFACRDMGIPGISITASHNPPEYVGLKLISREGPEAPRSEEERVEEAYEEARPPTGPRRRILKIPVADTYLWGTAEDLGLDLKIIVDASNGAASQIMGRGLSLSGLRVMGVFCSPGPRPCRGLDPANDELSDIRRLVVIHSAYAGAATDGDGDRLILVDDRGSVVRGDRILALLALRILGKGDKIVVSSVSSSIVDWVAERTGARVIRTRVGAPAVIEELRRSGARLGGEDNGGIVFGERPWRDSLYALLRLIKVLDGERLTDALSELPSIFSAETKIRVRDRIRAMEKISDTLKGEWVVDAYAVEIRGNRCLVRPSGTENVLRLYAEGKTPEEARLTLDIFTKMITKIIENKAYLKQK